MTPFSYRGRIFWPRFLSPLSDSYAKVQRIYNTIFAKKFLKSVFFGQNLMFFAFRTVQICHRWRHIRDTVLAQKHHASTAYRKSDFPRHFRLRPTRGICLIRQIAFLSYYKKEATFDIF